MEVVIPGGGELYSKKKNNWEQLLPGGDEGCFVEVPASHTDESAITLHSRNHARDKLTNLHVGVRRGKAFVFLCLKKHANIESSVFKQNNYLDDALLHGENGTNILLEAESL